MNIIVTGASRGIGYELVKKLSGNEHVIIAIARNADKLALLQQECELVKPGIKVIGLSCDLNNEKSVDELPDRIKMHCKEIDVIINNAGAIIKKPFREITRNDLQYVYSVNVFGVIHLLQKLLPMMNGKSRSHVVNISSMGGFQGSSKFAGLSAYSSSKAALACLTECLAEEFKENNIAFNCLALGAAQTEMLAEAFPGYKAPLTAHEMAAFIADFALKNHHFMNGKVIPVSMSTP